MKLVKWLVGVIALCGIALFVISSLKSGDDRKLIQEALDQSISASREGKPGGVLENISTNFKFNDSEIATRGDIGQYVKNMRPEVEILQREPTITGDTAKIISDVKVKFRLGPVESEQKIENVVITLQRENGTKFGIIPTKKWRIVTVSVPSYDPAAAFSN